MSGIFISIEGIEGTGKTTQARLLKEHIEKQGRRVILTKEPGGTPIGDEIRTILLATAHKSMDAVTELLLYFASRRQHMKEVVLPALKSNHIVITDRFMDSTLAYQGYARGLDLELIDSLNRLSTDGRRPDLTLLLDVDVETGMKRNRGANKIDRLELETVEFHKKVRDGFLLILKHDPGRVKLIESYDEPQMVHGKIIRIVDEFLSKHTKPDVN